MNKKETIVLLDKYLKGECSADEITLIESWYNHASADADVQVTADELEQVHLQMKTALALNPSRWFMSSYVRYAAAIISIAGASYLFFNQYRGKVSKPVDIAAQIMPGGNRATLTLANGQQIVLDDAKAGVIANQNGISVTKNKNGQIVYTVIAKQNAEAIFYNTISTPNGGQYQLILPDGSHVYLNAGSSLKYPIKFTAKERKVSLIGEAYLQVAKDPKRPFLVITEGQTLQVLGTHFNVSAYPSETIKTTLAEGSVKLISSSLQNQLLKPDQQASLLATGAFKVQQVNASDATAWKDGEFLFENATVAEMLHQICRWYNVEADFDHLPNVPISASASKSRTLHELIRFIEVSNGIKIRISDERRLTVSIK